MSEATTSRTLPRHGVAVPDRDTRRSSGPRSGTDDVPTPPAVEVRAARKLFGAKIALDGVDLTVPAGSFFVLLGPSGSGKTTLLRCVAGIERLNGGQVRLAGRLVADGAAHHPPEQRDLSMVFQDYALWPHLTAVRNVAFALRRRGVPRRDVATRSRQMLDRVGLGHLAARYPNELSGGEQQRVALARALVAETGLLLFDEPLSNLDADLRERLRLEIATLARDAGATSLYITHDQAEAFALADVVGVLDQGRLVQVGTPEEIYRAPANSFVARFTGLAGEIPARLHRIGGDGFAEVAVGASAEAGGTRRLLARAPRHLVPGTDAVLAIRPAGVQLLRQSEAQHPLTGGTAPSDGSAAPSAEHLVGTVADVAFRGRGYEHAVDLAGGGRLTGVFAAVRADRGEAVGLRLDPDSCHLFAAAPR